MNNLIKTLAKDLNKSAMIYRWQYTYEEVPSIVSLGNCKLNATAHLLEWQKNKTKTTPNHSGDVGQ